MMDRMEEELFPVITERQRMQSAPPDREERVGRFFRRVRSLGIGALRAPNTPTVRFGQPELDEGVKAEVPVFDRARHHPISLQLCGWDPLATAFWANLVIAGDGVGPVATGGAAAAPRKKGVRTSKAFGSLPSAIHDLHSLRDFYNPHRIGDLDVAYPESVSRSAGYFTHTVWLADPARETARTGIESVCHWVDVNSQDPEFRSVQLNIYFSGHGSPGTRLGDSFLLLRGEGWRTEEIVDALLDGLIRRQTGGDDCRICLFFDCCYAAAIARDFTWHLSRKRAERAGELRFGAVWCRSAFCSSLSDEESFDEEGLGNSYFTAAFLRENSFKRVPDTYPHLGEVSLRSDGDQNPVMIRWPRPDGDPEIRVPVLNYLTKAEQRELWRNDSLVPAVMTLAEQSGRVQDDGAIDPVDYVMCHAEHIRNVCMPRLRDPARARMPVVPYTARRSRWDR